MTPRQVWDQAELAERRVPHSRNWLRRRATFAHALGLLLPDVDFEVVAAGYAGQDNRPCVLVRWDHAGKEYEYSAFLPSHYPDADHMAYELERTTDFYRSKIMTPAEQHNANVAAAKIAVESAQAVVEKAVDFAGSLNYTKGVPLVKYEQLLHAQMALGEAQDALEEAEAPVYDKAKENHLATQIAYAGPGSDNRYELVKQLVAHMAGRPKP